MVQNHVIPPERFRGVPPRTSHFPMETRGETKWFQVVKTPYLGQFRIFRKTQRFSHIQIALNPMPLSGFQKKSWRPPPPWPKWSHKKVSWANFDKSSWHTNFVFFASKTCAKCSARFQDSGNISFQKFLSRQKVMDFFRYRPMKNQ